MKCKRVEKVPGGNQYYCITSEGDTVVLKKDEMIKHIMMDKVANASTFIRNGVICIRIDGAVKVKANTAGENESLEDRIINEIINKMKTGVVPYFLSTHQFLERLGLEEFLATNDAIEMIPNELIWKARERCESKGQKTYMMGILGKEGWEYDLLFATTNRRRGERVIQDHIKKKIIEMYVEKEMSAEDIQLFVEEQRKRIIN